MNVWLALLLEDHVHRAVAKAWWDTDVSEAIGFLRFTQIAVLRLLTNAAAMNNSSSTPYYPAACNHAIAVSASDGNDKRPSEQLDGTRIDAGPAWADVDVSAGQPLCRRGDRAESHWRLRPWPSAA